VKYFNIVSRTFHFLIALLWWHGSALASESAPDTCHSILVSPSAHHDQLARCFSRVGAPAFHAWAASLQPDTATCNALHHLSEALHDTDPSNSLRVGLLARDMALRTKANVLLRARIEHDIGYAANEVGKYAVALKHFRECARLYEQIGDRYLLAECHYYIGGVLVQLDDTVRALESKRRYVELAEEGGVPGQQVEALRSLAATVHRFGEPGVALEQLDRALAIATMAADSVEMALCLQDIARVRRGAGNLEESLRLLQQSIVHLPSKAYAPFIIQISNDIASILAEQGRFHEAARVQEEALQNARTSGYRPEIAHAHLELSNHLQRGGKPAEALLHAQEGLREATAAGLLKLRFRGLNLLSEQLRATGQYHLALAYSDSLLTTKESLDKLKGEVEAARLVALADYETIRVKDRLTAMEEKVRNDAKHRRQRIIMVVMVGMIILVAVVLFARARKLRRIQLEQLRTRLSRDLHDDIGSTLSSINILSTVARSKAETGDEAGAAASLSGISERTQRLMRNMSDIVWSVDPDKDTMDELLVRMREFGAAVLEPKGVSYRFTTTGELNAAMPPLLKSNIYLIFKEAINNAAKHSQATEVKVSFAREKHRMRMTISDNGKGLEQEGATTSTMGGNGLRNIRARAAEMKAELRMNSTAPAGTTIELVVAM
jgi:two-component system sensor histidine kinase UhpB